MSNARPWAQLKRSEREDEAPPLRAGPWRRSLGAGLAAAGPDQRVAGSVFRVELVRVDRLGEEGIASLTERESRPSFERFDQAAPGSQPRPPPILNRSGRCRPHNSSASSPRPRAR